jgi:hypothetical protein
MVQAIGGVSGGQTQVQGLRGDNLAQQLKQLGMDENQANALGDASKTMNNLDLEKLLKGILQALQERQQQPQQAGGCGGGGSGGGGCGGGGSAQPVDNARSSQPSCNDGGGGDVPDASGPKLEFNPETGKWEVKDPEGEKKPDKVDKPKKPDGAQSKPSAAVSVAATGGKGGK